MKYFNLYTFLFSSFFSLTLFSGCSDWLDVDKLGSLEEKEIYKDETNINAVLNGFYSSMTEDKLYGGHLALTTVEYLGHYYYYPERNPGEQVDSNNKIWDYYLLGNYGYGEDVIKDRFAQVWEKGYEVIFGLNLFIKNVIETDAVNEKKRNLLLGEAYGLRAFLHFDLFRLFGPVYVLDSSEESIPYNDQPAVTSYENLPANQFLERVMNDIEKAKELLEEDPILTEGLNDYTGLKKRKIDLEDLSSNEAFHTIFRNRRFNYYAVAALEARVLLYKGDYQTAADRALEIIESTQNNEDDDLKLFEFEDRTKIVTNVNYIFYKEIIFGLHNINLGTTWKNAQQSTIEGAVHSVSEFNLKNNIFTAESDDFSASQDYRTRQWLIAPDFGERMFSSKYKMEALKTDNEIKNHQPLIRISEMYFILAESYLALGNTVGAAQAIAKVQIARGIQGASSEYATDDSTEDFLQDLLEREYYKEFFAEGQVFFFHKRRNSEEIFKGYGTGKDEMNSDRYVVPLPKSETNL